MKLRILLLSTLFWFSACVWADDVWLVPIKGAIGPATSDYVTREIELATEDNIKLIILVMDTPGGLDSAMRDIIKAITSSSIPIATWVGPSGARAASAGTYILLASQIAAMADATNLGAATPVSIGPPTQRPSQEPEEPRAKNSPSKETHPQTLDSQENRHNEGDTAKPEKEKNNAEVPANTAMEKKVINDARAYIKGLARLHGRNAEWAETAVSEAASINANEALALGVIDFIANSPDSLVKQAVGRTLLIQNQPTTFTLNEQPRLIERAPDWRAQILATITNPNVAYILMLIGIYGLILEFYNPGIGLPGVLGGICLLVAMYSFQMLPVNYAGFALILLGVALMVAEAFNPSFGILGLGGIVAFVLGSLFLMDNAEPNFQIALPLIFGFAIFSALIIFLMLTMLLRIRRKQVTTGIDAFPGKQAVVLEGFVDEQAGFLHGTVLLDGARWDATSDSPHKQGEKVTITQIKGLTLNVTKTERTKAARTKGLPAQK
ncbi:nodulation protein NfeD [Vibrio sinensis]|uniref:Nodulation protein NfeD n=1 Tax=Vibrio sinensis TaxID=2302434 RepID=A0A3A6QRL5_9VIBR|nr:nodulation protein NfeD [Vibrio sinensis]RJX71431.1 nodulation protein NfeD [Vibrio sinensis]